MKLHTVCGTVVRAEQESVSSAVLVLKGFIRHLTLSSQDDMVAR